MTDFVRGTGGDLPASIDTVEKLNAWSNAVLAYNNPTEGYIEAPNTAAIFRFINPELRIPNQELIRVYRSALIMDEALIASGLPHWKCVKEFGTVSTIPAAFKA